MIALLIACATEDAVYLRTPPGRAGALASHLSNLIFWNDELEVSDLSAETVQIGLFGPGAAKWLADAAGVALDDLQPYAWRSGSIGGTPAMIQRGGALEAPDWTVIAAAKHVDELRAILTAAAPALNEGQAEVIRVEKGIPAWGSELSDQVTPLEAGLRDGHQRQQGLLHRPRGHRPPAQLRQGDAAHGRSAAARGCADRRSEGRDDRPAAAATAGAASSARPSGRPRWSGPSPWPSSRVTLQSRALRLRSAPARARSSPRSPICHLWGEQVGKANQQINKQGHVFRRRSSIVYRPSSVIERNPMPDFSHR